MERVQIKGIENLKKEEKYQLNKIVNSYYEKIKRQLNQDFTLLLKIKEYQGAGNGKKEENKAHKFSIQAQIKSTAQKLEASAADWDLNRTIHSVLKKLIEEIEHRFHVSEQRK